MHAMASRHLRQPWRCAFNVYFIDLDDVYVHVADLTGAEHSACNANRTRLPYVVLTCFCVICCFPYSTCTIPHIRRTIGTAVL